MSDPVDGRPFWVPHDQFLYQKRRADIAEARVAILGAALARVAAANGVWEEPDEVEPGSPVWELAFAWYDHVLGLKRLARNALQMAQAEAE